MLAIHRHVTTLTTPIVGWVGGGIWAVDSQKNHLKCFHHMSYLKAKIHRNRFSLGFRPSAPPDPPAGFKGVLLKEREGKKEGQNGEGTAPILRRYGPRMLNPALRPSTLWQSTLSSVPCRRMIARLTLIFVV